MAGLDARFLDLMELTSRQDWDDEGALAISAEQWQEACRIADDINDILFSIPNTPECYPSVCGDGDINLRWSNATRSVNVELGENRMLQWTIRDESGRHRYGGSAQKLIEDIRELFEKDTSWTI